MDNASAVVFIDNQDTQRGNAQLTFKTEKLYQLANVFMLAHPYGYPKVMSSYLFDTFDQGPPATPVHSIGSSAAVACGAGSPWVCEHRWLAIANMVGWRRSAGDAVVSNFQVADDDTVAFCRGAAACIALNRQETPTTATFTFPLPAGSYCDVIQSDDSSSCPTVSVPENSSVTLHIPALGAVALHVGKKVETTRQQTSTRSPLDETVISGSRHSIQGSAAVGVIAVSGVVVSALHAYSVQFH